MTPFVRSAFNYDMDEASLSSAVPQMLFENDISPTVQSEKDNSDINVLVKRFGLTGTIPQNLRLPLPEDFVGVTDFHSAMQAVRLAQESFMSVPADIRAKFKNDPQLFAEFVVDENNLEELDKMGLTSQDGKDKLIARRTAAQLKEREDHERSVNEAIERREAASRRTASRSEGL